MARAFVSVGSNVNPEPNVEEALTRLAECVKIVGVSTFYRSEPVGPAGQPAFVNGMVEVVTELAPRELKFGTLRRIEAELGRVRTSDKYAPRPIDLDVVVYEDWVVAEEELRLPDPEIGARPFLAVPLAELAPDLALPGDGRAMREIAAEFGDHTMAPLREYAERLREKMRHGP